MKGSYSYIENKCIYNHRNRKIEDENEEEKLKRILSTGFTQLTKKDQQKYIQIYLFFYRVDIKKVMSNRRNNIFLMAQKQRKLKKNNRQISLDYDRKFKHLGNSNENVYKNFLVTNFF